MKTSATYGFVGALAGAFLVLLQYFAGLHSDPAKLGVANAIGGIGGLVIGISAIVLGMRARRAEAASAGHEYGYGPAFAAGFQVSLVSCLVSAVFTYCYYAFINPAFTEVLTEDALAKAQAKGLSGAQLDRMQGFYHGMFSPLGALIVTIIFGLIGGVVISLLAAIFVRSKEPPRVAAV
jgi:hypothetical protein